MLGRTFCPLGDAAAMPMISYVEKFRDEFEAYLRKNPVPSGELVSLGADVMADLVNLTIDGKAVQAAPGTLVIDAAKTVGIEIPAFCYYEGLSLQAACRMCLVEVEKMPKLVTACTLPVGEGMVVRTDTEQVAQGSQDHAGIPADQPSAGLSGLRQGRRVRTAGHGVPLWRRRKPLHGSQASRG